MSAETAGEMSVGGNCPGDDVRGYMSGSKCLASYTGTVKYFYN